MTYIINNYEFFLQALTAVKEKLQVGATLVGIYITKLCIHRFLKVFIE